MVMARDVPHEDTHWAVIAFAAVAAPLALHPHRVGTPLGEAAGSKGDHAIGLAHASGHVTHSHLEQRAMIPERGADERLQDQAFDIDQSRNRLSILAVQVGQKASQIEVHVALAGLGLKRVLIGHREVTQALNYVVEDIGGHDAITQ
jgi:hypothetical protein